MDIHPSRPPQRWVENFVSVRSRKEQPTLLSTDPVQRVEQSAQRDLRRVTGGTPLFLATRVRDLPWLLRSSPVDRVVEGSINVFHQRNTLLWEIRDELVKRVIIEGRAREGDDENVEPELPCKTVNYRGLPSSGGTILRDTG